MSLPVMKRDVSRYRFALPTDIWSRRLKPPAFAVLAYLQYRHCRKIHGVPAVRELAAISYSLYIRELLVCSPVLIRAFAHKQFQNPSRCDIVIAQMAQVIFPTVQTGRLDIYVFRAVVMRYDPE